MTGAWMSQCRSSRNTYEQSTVLPTTTCATTRHDDITVTADCGVRALGR
jgi:hypothetical protein